MKLQRSLVLGGTAAYSSLEMRNASDKCMYISLIECDGGITGEFSGWSQLGKSEIELIYAVLPEDYADELNDDEKGGCYVGSIRLPTRSEIENEEESSQHTIGLLTYRTHRPPTKLVACIAAWDSVSIFIEQHEVYKFIDDNGSEIPLENLLGGKHSS